MLNRGVFAGRLYIVVLGNFVFGSVGQRLAVITVKRIARIYYGFGKLRPVFAPGAFRSASPVFGCLGCGVRRRGRRWIGAPGVG